MEEVDTGKVTLAIIGIILIIAGVVVVFNAISVGFWLGIVLGLAAVAAGSIMMHRLL